jgi:hypothetical protein
MLGGHGTPDNYNAQIASSLYVRESSKKTASRVLTCAGVVRSKIEEKSIVLFCFIFYFDLTGGL